MSADYTTPYAPPRSDDDERTGRTRRWPAMLATMLICPGAGHLALGRWRRAGVWFALRATFWTAMVVAVVIDAPWPAILLAAAGYATYPLSMIDVFRTARVPILKPTWTTVCKLWVVIALGAISLTAVVRAHVVEAFEIPGGSMAPTLLVGDHVFVVKLRGAVARGDVVVFRYPPDREVQYLKRAVAFGGETLEMKDQVVYVDGEPLPISPSGERVASDENAAVGDVYEERIGNDAHAIVVERAGRSAGPFTVPVGQVFFLGDNRDASNDSRSWGSVPLSDVTGRAAFVWWSRSASGAIRWDRIGRRVR